MKKGNSLHILQTKKISEPYANKFEIEMNFGQFQQSSTQQS